MLLHVIRVSMIIFLALMAIAMWEIERKGRRPHTLVLVGLLVVAITFSVSFHRVDTIVNNSYVVCENGNYVRRSAFYDEEYIIDMLGREHGEHPVNLFEMLVTRW